MTDLESRQSDLIAIFSNYRLVGSCVGSTVSVRIKIISRCSAFLLLLLRALSRDRDNNAVGTFAMTWTRIFQTPRFLPRGGALKTNSPRGGLEPSAIILMRENRRASLLIFSNIVIAHRERQKFGKPASESYGGEKETVKVYVKFTDLQGNYCTMYRHIPFFSLLFFSSSSSFFFVSALFHT